MEQTTSIRIGKQSEVTIINEILTACKKDLEDAGIYQWNASYPNEEYFSEKIAAAELFVIEEEERIVGAFVLDEWQPTEWAQISWRYDQGRYLVLHSFFIHPERQGRGYGKAVLIYMEELATARNYAKIRLDVFSKNQTALKLYENNGYIKTGEVTFPSKPVNNQIYYCYEKLLPSG